MYLIETQKLESSFLFDASQIKSLYNSFKASLPKV